PQAMAILNDLRADAGLGPLPDPGGSADAVLEYLLHERFAELFLEGQRMNDLHRFGLVDDLV
ncbi:MAG: RagB/SusD family nutrient uptake outer membrane protein, partial [Gammaproteobacteria bacterium]|nr:RagB/SusD family nutrient uptake outer membrane protein [Gammaproteobacteria bacterium]